MIRLFVPGPLAEGLAVPLAPDQVLSVYPLIREAMPEVDLTAWTDFARRVTGRRSHNAGIMAAWREGRSFPCGLFCYRVDKTLAQGRVLIAESSSSSAPSVAPMERSRACRPSARATIVS